MPILHDPKKMLRKIAPKKKIERLIKGDLSVNKAVLSMFDEVDFISKRDIATVALNTSKQYKARYKEERESGESVSAAKETTLNGKKMLISRVENAVVHQVAQTIKEEYEGEYYKWLPSDADTPDPEHQLNYGKVFQIGDGEFPGERYGCRCAAEILVKGSKLEL